MAASGRGAPLARRVDHEMLAGDGQIWVCPACGRRSKDRYRMGDTSCVTWAVLCHETPGEDGKYTPVEATDGK